jgi:phosphoglycerate dehydrogenase-like enzyme
MGDPLVIWCNLPFGAAASSGQQAFVEALAAHTLHLVDSTTPPDEARARLAQAAIAFGHPPIEALLASDTVRWVAISSAGYDAYDRPDLRTTLTSRGAALTNAGGVYADACAQHVLALMLAAARGLPAAMEAQRDRRWTFAEQRSKMRRLSGQRVVILGWGRIARRLVELLAPFDLHVTVLRRRPVGDEPVPVVTAEGLDTALANADHLVDLLPGGDGTKAFVDAARLSRLPNGAWFYNIGRGSTVDQDALIAALDSRRLAGAYLDVTDPEPLPPDHPLWRTPGCYITPHLAGGQIDERGHQVRHFLDNLARFVDGRALVDRIW